MKTLKNQKGFTLIELMIVGTILSSLLICGGVIYVALHFIAKLW
jgi:prepilin-type N-terminal cleavage/methylation domain-containing protein